MPTRGGLRHVRADILPLVEEVAYYDMTLHNSAAKYVYALEKRYGRLSAEKAIRIARLIKGELYT